MKDEAKALLVQLATIKQPGHETAEVIDMDISTVDDKTQSQANENDHSL